MALNIDNITQSSFLKSSSFENQKDGFKKSFRLDIGERDRKLEDRSYLRFEFYESGRSAPHVRYLLFYENPDIKESRKGLHAKYQPISRNSTLLAYTGAESRQFSVSFKLTLPHIVAYADSIYANKNSKYQSKEELRKQFTKSFSDSGNNATIAAAKGNADNHAAFFEEITLFGETTTDGAIGSNPFGNGTVAPTGSVKADPTQLKAIDLIMYWTNLVRSSVLNNAKNPTNGPPIIRLNHGILYQDIPCVALDYKIDYDKSHGADLRTLLPRVISFEINLQETRVGDFGDFDVNKMVARDNTVGWEAMIGNVNTIDPVRYDIGVIKR
jgi:hypothetical protein